MEPNDTTPTQGPAATANDAQEGRSAPDQRRSDPVRWIPIFVPALAVVLACGAYFVGWIEFAGR